jgi:hypothetical protein
LHKTVGILGDFERSFGNLRDFSVFVGIFEDFEGFISINFKGAMRPLALLEEFYSFFIEGVEGDITNYYTPQHMTSKLICMTHTPQSKHLNPLNALLLRLAD